MALKIEELIAKLKRQMPELEHNPILDEIEMAAHEEEEPEGQDEEGAEGDENEPGEGTPEEEAIDQDEESEDVAPPMPPKRKGPPSPFRK